MPSNRRKWVKAGRLDHDRDISEGAIELPNALKKKIDAKVVVVRRQAEDAPEVQLKLSFAGRLAATTSDVDFARLKMEGAGQPIEVRSLTFGETALRLGLRILLPLLALLAAIAAVVAAAVPGVKDEMGILTACLAVPAAILAFCRAAREP
jgi:hypothetical protein